jgi:cobalt-zinc-cadmium efflux system protein
MPGFRASTTGGCGVSSREAHNGHGHSLPGAGHRRTLAVVLGISGTILAVEVIGAFVSGSLALLADAGHMLTDVAGLSLALVAAVLLAVGGFVLVEAIRRLIEPSPVASGVMAIFGVVGLAGNAVSIVLLSRISGGNLNTRAARLEVVNDALGSVAVLAAAGLIALTGWDRADASLLIGALILPRTWKLLREAVDVLMEATPKGVDLAHVRAHILGVPHVHAVHDLHASSVSSDLPVLTAHVVVDDSCFRDGHLPRLLDQLQQCLAGHFDVEHSTVQFEPAGHAAHEHPAHA